MQYQRHALCACFPVLPSILCSFLLWCGYYKLMRWLLPEREPEFTNRIVTLTHGCTSAFFGINQCFEDTFDSPRQSFFESMLLVFSLGYFLFDLVWCAIHQTETKLMIFHHIFSIMSLYRVIYKQYAGSQSTCALGCMEISNPILQARWFIRTAGYHHTVLFNTVELVFMFVFIVVRIFFGTAFVVNALLLPDNPKEFKFYCFSLYVISIMFTYYMLQYAHKRYLYTDELEEIGGQ